MYINKKLNHSHAFSFFRLFSFSAFLLSHVCFSTSLLHLLVAASLKKTLKSLIPHLRRKPTKPSEPSAPTNPQSPTHSQPQIEGASSHPIHSSAPLSNLFSSNPYSNRRRFISSRMTRRRFFSSILNRRRHPQSSGSLFTYD